MEVQVNTYPNKSDVAKLMKLRVSNVDGKFNDVNDFNMYFSHVKLN